LLFVAIAIAVVAISYYDKGGTKPEGRGRKKVRGERREGK